MLLQVTSGRLVNFLKDILLTTLPRVRVRMLKSSVFFIKLEFIIWAT